MYNIQSKKVTYNFLTKEILPVYTGAKGEVVFDSKSEFACYKVLELTKMPIEVHKYVKHLDWHIDFTVTFLYPHPILALLQNLGYSLYNNNYLFVEYKGVLGEELICRYKSIPPILQKNLLIVTKAKQEIVYFDKFSNSTIKRPTLALNTLRKLLDGSYQKLIQPA